MAEKKQLGIYWEQDFLFCVEVKGGLPCETFKIPIPEGSLETADRLELISVIRQALKTRRLQYKKIHLSLPAREIIFRSFILPWMPPNDLRNVVKFEAGKYIPFSLDELSYSYLPIEINEEGKKQLRIIFVAVKLDTLNDYTNSFLKVPLQVPLAEPAPISLIRVLSKKDIISEIKAIALVEQSAKKGKITIVDHGVPQFVREFQLLPYGQQQDSAPDASGAATTRLINEIRISLDYFSRQYNQIRVEEIVFLTDLKEKVQYTSLAEELNVTVKSITTNDIIPNIRENEVSYLNAVGACFADATESTTAFNLSLSKTTSSGRNYSLSSSLNVKALLPTAIICAVMMILSFLLPGFLIAQTESEIETIRQELGPYQSASDDMILATTQEYEKKLEEFKSIESESDIALFLALAPIVLPEGVWLQSMEIGYEENNESSASAQSTASGEHIQIDIGGYAYADSPNQQFRLVDEYISNIRSHESFKPFFTQYNVVTLNAQKIQDIPVTYFQLEMR